MKLIPNYTVSYKGVFHKAGAPFEIEDVDAVNMSKHGTVIYDFAPGAAETAAPIEPGWASAEKPEEGALAEMTKDELLAYAAERGYDHIKRRMTKAEILEALL